MAESGFVDVSWIEGPYDGSRLELPALYWGAGHIDMPDPATAGDDGADEPAVFTGPTHRYRLERTTDGLRALFVGTS